ncbi:MULTISPECIES: poly-gamma-glutamate hydrolase family protein [Staphylococcus]|jgi:phage replication-related protein YjqB (UPF0714/DUF867 family)|uniref:Poly-gamma-glutamate hydrolase family protein n=2 Tax=Staphylococcus nepalensis TaxID=214473 RepID=A0ABS3L203_9STAP|nr:MULTISPECIES: poly-gamma-glutamate hydrolase family protein [Staphylococcus]MBO1205967.1 poly-gamma-glutamate hydrolase family protein [Staphylococcus nepalensis]MBO1214642.1 poly-gamma-glutamate hydrolase family protein [Staphylococcus nepalensis]MBO1216674.1 poly-gamma-glutamate hydrolase family protein [Staphylococcus nepalensis]MBO1227582.1 poly-gamma-glutamate hydrolase family protein [Staphylococcus nepalensis]MBO1235660.1 poly-gamma-glutamate hydrolase family protein [Staphylococcus 
MKNILKTYLYYLIMLVIVGIVLLGLYFTYVWNQDQPQNHDQSQHQDQSHNQDQSQNQDKYQNFSQLKSDTEKNSDWQRNIKKTNNKDILITAIHGGGIEPGTSELAKIISKKGDFNLYSFEGLLKSNNKQLHITSTRFDDSKLKEMSNKSKESISIHGFQSDENAVYIGGRDKKMADSIKKELEKEGFNVEESPNRIDGSSNNNFINKNDSGSGVQLEISTSIRKSFFKKDNLDRKTRENTSKYRQSIYDFAEAVTKGIHSQT